MQPVIRPSVPDDHEALVEQFMGLNLYEEPLIGNRRTDLEGARESLAAGLRRVEETGGSALVAEIDGHVVGHLFLVFEQDAVFVREDLRPYAYVSELFVREHVRGVGVGKALMAEAERLALARGMRRLMIGVLVGNDPAQSLYASLGFQPHALDMEKRLGT